MGSIGGSVVSRRAGSASTGRAVTRRGIRPRATSSDAISSIRTDARLCSWSRSIHDFVSDISSLSGARFRHCRSACVGSGKSRPLPPPLVKGTACHDPRCLPSARGPFSLSEAPRSESCDAARVVHTLLARCFACAALRAEDLRKTEFCNLDTTTHGRQPVIELAALSSRHTVVRFVSRVDPFEPEHAREPRRSTSPYGACLTTRRNCPLRVDARFGIAPSLQTRARATGRVPACAGVLRTKTEPTTFPQHAARFVLRLAARPIMAS